MLPMNIQMSRARAILEEAKIRRLEDGYLVPSQRGGGFYLIRLLPTPTCNCPQYEIRSARCKHILAVQLMTGRGGDPVAS